MARREGIYVRLSSRTSKITNLSYADLAPARLRAKFSEAVLAAEYRWMRDVANKRVNRLFALYEKGEISARNIPSYAYGGFPSSKGMTKGQLAANVSRVAEFLRGESTVKDVKVARERTRQHLSKSFGVEFADAKAADMFLDFLEQMRDYYIGIMFPSDELQEVLQSKGTIDTKAVSEVYEIWLDYQKQEFEAGRLQQVKGRTRTRRVKTPSTQVRRSKI